MPTRRKAAKPRRKSSPRKARQLEEQPEPEEKALEPEVLEPDDVPDQGPQTTLPVPVGRDLARADALQRYMAEVAKHPLLTREEEHKLAVKFARTHEPGIADRLVPANLRLGGKTGAGNRPAPVSLHGTTQ